MRGPLSAGRPVRVRRHLDGQLWRPLGPRQRRPRGPRWACSGSTCRPPTSRTSFFLPWLWLSCAADAASESGPSRVTADRVAITEAW